jgi:hypothetical protein
MNYIYCCVVVDFVLTESLRSDGDVFVLVFALHALSELWQSVPSHASRFLRQQERGEPADLHSFAQPAPIVSAGPLA